MIGSQSHKIVHEIVHGHVETREIMSVSALEASVYLYASIVVEQDDAWVVIKKLNFILIVFNIKLHRIVR